MAMILALAPIYLFANPQPQTGATQNTSQGDQRGSDANPVVIKVVPAPNAEKHAAKQEEIEGQKARREERLIGATISLAVITLFLAAFTAGLWWATYRLAKEAKESSATQAAKMGESVSQSARGAAAMEYVAVSMAASAQTAQDAVATQKDFWQRQMRAYVSVLVGNATAQLRPGLKFDARPILRNTGNTPAHRVRYRIMADILPVPLPADFHFALPQRNDQQGMTVHPHQPFDLFALVNHFVPDDEVEIIKIATSGRALYCWGLVEYDDAFGNARATKFCHMILWLPGAGIYGHYDGRFNEAN